MARVALYLTVDAANDLAAFEQLAHESTSRFFARALKLEVASLKMRQLKLYKYEELADTYKRDALRSLAYHMCAQVLTHHPPHGPVVLHDLLSSLMNLVEPLPQHRNPGLPAFPEVLFSETGVFYDGSRF